MAKFSKKGWSSDFNSDNFTCDQMDWHVEGLRDDLYGRHNPVSRSGKTIHPHKPVGEAPREFTSDELFATMVEAAKNGDCQRQFLAGLGYAKRGDMKNAKYWLKKAADRNWPEAREKFGELIHAGDADLDGFLIAEQIRDCIRLEDVKAYKALYWARRLKLDAGIPLTDEQRRRIAAYVVKKDANGTVRGYAEQLLDWGRWIEQESFASIFAAKKERSCR